MRIDLGELNAKWVGRLVRAPDLLRDVRIIEVLSVELSDISSGALILTVAVEGGWRGNIHAREPCDGRILTSVRA